MDPSSHNSPSVSSVGTFAIGGRTAGVVSGVHFSQVTSEENASLNVNPSATDLCLTFHNGLICTSAELGSPIPLAEIPAPANGITIVSVIHAPSTITVITGHNTGAATADRVGAVRVDRWRRLGRRSTLLSATVPCPSVAATNARDHSMGCWARPGGVRMTASTTTVPSSSHVSGRKVLPRVGTARRVLVVVAVAPSVPVDVSQSTRGIRARGGTDVDGDAVTASDERWVTLGPQARWIVGSVAVYVDVSATADVEGTGPLMVAASPRLARPAAADHRLLQPVIAMVKGPSSAKLSSGGIGGSTGVIPETHVAFNTSGSGKGGITIGTR